MKNSEGLASSGKSRSECHVAMLTGAKFTPSNASLTPKLTLRERLAIRLLGLATWALPPEHGAILSIHLAADEIERYAVNGSGSQL